MRIGIFENKKFERDRLSSFIRQYFHANYSEAELLYFAAPEQFFNSPEPVTCDLAFIHYELKECGEICDSLHRQNESCVVILLTESPDNGEGERKLVIPYSMEDLTTLLDKEFLEYFKNIRSIDLKIEKKDVRIMMSHIQFTNVEGHNTVIHLENDDDISVRMTFGRFVDMIGFDPRFLICNRSLAVNMDKINDLDEDHIILNDGSSVPLKRKLQHKPLNDYKNYLNGQPSLSI